MATKLVEISHVAYGTMILHCSKYPSSEVLGFLLGSTSSTKVLVEKSIAVQHHWNRLSPMVEVAASLAEVYAASQSPPLQLIGIYHAPSDSTSSSSSRPELSPVAVKVAQIFAKKIGNDVVALQIDNSQLNSATAHALNGFTVSSSASTTVLPAKSIELKDDTSISQVKKAIANGSWKNVFDFDDHLEDTSLNWLTPTTIS